MGWGLQVKRCAACGRQRAEPLARAPEVGVSVSSLMGLGSEGESRVPGMSH